MKSNGQTKPQSDMENDKIETLLRWERGIYHRLSNSI